MMLITLSSKTAPQVPNDPQRVVAEWSVQAEYVQANNPASKQATMTLAANLINDASQPGKSHLYGRVNAIIEPWLQADADAELWYLKARIEQHNHQFDAALAILDKILVDQPKHNNANLMAVRLNLIKQSFDQAKHHCRQLTADAYMNVVAVCLLEVASHEGQLASSYALLKNMFKGAELAPPYRLWIGLMLSDMANRLALFEESASWLAQFAIDDDLSYLTTWAETQLKLNQPQAVINRLAQIHESNPAIEDALLLQLALAEHQLNSRQNTHHDRWKQLISQRVRLRELRQDNHHAGELAQYYLWLEHNPAKAKHWATLNWQQAQEHKDKQLLDAALLAQHPITAETD